MTEKTLYNKLTNILSTVDAEKYPDICSIIECNLGSDGFVYVDAFDLAVELHDADGAEVLPKDVADLLIEIYLEEIENENADAMTNLGSLYYTGRCGEQNYEKAVKYYTMADKHGERQATENLGYCYYYGRTGEVDYKKAYHYFVKGALDNHLNSLYKIADMYKNGYYVEKDEREAFYIYRHCYEQMTNGHADMIGADICLRMGNVYYYGIGTEKNYELALKYYQEAEQHFYRKINNGDFFARKSLEDVIEKQDRIRKELLKDLPKFTWKG